MEDGFSETAVRILALFQVRKKCRFNKWNKKKLEFSALFTKKNRNVIYIPRF